MLAQTLVLGKISFSVLSFWYYHILFYTKCDYQIKKSQFQEFLVFWFLSFVFLTNWMSRFQESNSLIRNSQFLNFSYLGILDFAMNVGFSQNGFSANKIPSFQNPSFVIPIKTFLVLSFPVSCVNRILLRDMPFRMDISCAGWSTLEHNNYLTLTYISVTALSLPPLRNRLLLHTASIY